MYCINCNKTVDDNHRCPHLNSEWFLYNSDRLEKEIANKLTEIKFKMDAMEKEKSLDKKIKK
jgi:hypothetical protein